MGNDSSRRLTYVESDHAAGLDRYWRTRAKKVPSFHDLLLSLTEGKVVEVTLIDLMGGPMPINVRVTAFGQMPYGTSFPAKVQLVGKIVKLTQRTPRSLLDKKEWSELHADYDLERRLMSTFWLPRNFDFGAYAEGNISARDPQFAHEWPRL